MLEDMFSVVISLHPAFGYKGYFEMTDEKEGKKRTLDL
jgi:hypothetical protein